MRLFQLVIRLALLLAVVSSWAAPSAPPQIVESDLCVFGGTAGGVVAAVQAARMGKRAVIAEPGAHLGGMTAGGLSAVDIGDPRTVGGIAREYFTQLAGAYGKTLAWDKPFRSTGGPATGGAFAIEPHRAEALFNEMVRVSKIPVHFHARLAAVRKDGVRIRELVMEDGAVFRAKMFIDATYEGDLMARAGVSCTLMREGNAKYGEHYNGINYSPRFAPRWDHVMPGPNGRAPSGLGVWDRDLPLDPYVVPGNPRSGLLPLIQAGDPGREGDPAPGVQAYCYRLCMTTAADRIPVAPPPDYDPARYEIVARFIAACLKIGDTMDLRWFAKYDPLPNGKFDFNTATFGANLPGASWEWPEASYARRAEIAKEHENYHRGLLHFLAADPRVPATVRDEVNKFGLPRDEFVDNGGWPHQLYIREARRMVSDLVMTEHHTFGRQVAPNSIGLGSYGTDTHEIRRNVKDGVVIREGKMALAREGAGPYPIGYGAIVPKPAECENLLVTFALSASHTAFSSIRMEPVFMVSSQSAATAACQAIDDGVAIQNVDYAKLKKRLLADKQVLEWTEPADPPAGDGKTSVTQRTAKKTQKTVKKTETDRAKKESAITTSTKAAIRYADTLAAKLEPARTVVYKKIGDRELKLHIFEPKDWKATDHRPCFIGIHGGGWTGGEPRNMYPFIDHFVKVGMVGISVEYRLLKTGEGVTVFDCVRDSRSAVRWVRAHAGELGIEPRKIAVSGGSAGGHLAAATAMFEGIDEPGEDTSISPVPNAMVLYYPVIDTSKEGYGNAKIGERWRELSPLHQVRPGLPPAIVFHGTGDVTTPFKGAQAFHNAMVKAGNRCELVVNEGGAHGYLLKSKELFEDTLAQTEDFLISLAILKISRTAPDVKTPKPLVTVDLSSDTTRQVVVAAGTATIYQGHPTTLLLPDGKTMYCVWTIGHGGACGPMKRSDDGGRTWSELLPVPRNWTEARNCPSIYRLPDPRGKTRLFVFAGSGPDKKMQQSFSEDDGKTWTPMAGNGLTCVMPFTTIVPVEGGKKLLAQTNIRRPGETKEKRSNIIAQSMSSDGGMTWSPWRIVLDMGPTMPCEPEIVRSPDGRQLLCLMRENSRKIGGLFMTSDDEGANWSKPRALPPGLHGDRHKAQFAPDGRLVVCFRDVGLKSPTRDHFVAWVGRYEDIVAGRDGQYRIKLLHSYAKGDCGYPGLEILADGTFVATTYIKYRPGPEKQSVVSTRFKLAETDALAQKKTDGENPVWAARLKVPGTVRVAVAPPEDPAHAHLAWPRALRARDGTIVLACLAGAFHGGGGCPAVSLSTDGGKTFSPPRILREFGPGRDYANSGNLALGLADDGAVVLLAMAHSGDTKNNIFGWRSEDHGRTWAPVDTSALGPNKTGSVTGTIVSVPGVGLMAAGHYRKGSAPETQGIWVSTSRDGGRSWSPASKVTGVDAGEPVLVRAGSRLLIFIRGRGKNAGRQHLAVSDDNGATWRTYLTSIAAANPKSSLTHPFAMLNPNKPGELIALTAERPLPGQVWLWRGDPQKLEWKRDRLILELPKIEGDSHNDYGYPWLVPLDSGRALVFYYHGLGRGANAIWAAEIEM